MTDPVKEIVLGLQNTVEILVTNINSNPQMVAGLLSKLSKNVPLVMHSARVMTFVMKFCFKNNYSAKHTKLLSIGALLHDIGKTQLPDRLLNTEFEKLSSDDKILWQSHPNIGYQMLEDCGLEYDIIKFAALEHHERLDGSGYPNHTKKMSILGQLLGLIDRYDTLKNAPNPGKKVMSAMEVLKRLMVECETGKLNKELFESFIYSLM